ncbi:MAG TPA: hypothetical protein PLS07_04900 [Niabella sp.]|nr:hypothetical protein [Niabella sp.]HRB87095.1 hypothetical protein [Bacteroidia bacterium]HQX21588.1 hypothetical protein [Niabella sp.]HRB42018.1 hypothetical protein [Niabella sp.]HRB47989.1 hypothetical protein [Niabella sp.]
MCQVFGYSKQAYYMQLQLNANTAVKEEVVVGLIKKNGKHGNVAAVETCTSVYKKNLKPTI